MSAHVHPVAVPVIVGRSWRLYTSGSAGVDSSLAAERDASFVTAATA